MLKPFNCDIYINDIIDYNDFYKKNNLKKVNLDFLLANSDIISIHIPLNNDNFNLISESKIKLMKPNSILINTARGGIVDEGFLKYSLINNKIAAAAFDVFYEEPNTDLELLNLDNFFATPHIGGSSDEAILAMGRSAISGLYNYLIKHES
jgi:D-3-phosphoglycerate dehydrogenase